MRILSVSIRANIERPWRMEYFIRPDWIRNIFFPPLDRVDGEIEREIDVYV